MRVQDPVIARLPEDLQDKTVLAPTPASAAQSARVLIMAIRCPQYRTQEAVSILAGMAGELIILDPNRFLDVSFRHSGGLCCVSVGDAVGRTHPEQEVS